VLGAVEDFRGMSAHVEAGIVVLSGEAPSGDAVARAVETVEKLDGALLVVSDVRVERRLSKRLAEAWQQVLGRGRELIASFPLYATALAILLLAWGFARWLRDAKGIYRLASRRELLQNILRQTLYFAVLLLGALGALRFLDAGALIGTILGAAGLVGVAIGFAFKNVLENYLAGVLLAIRQPFRVRDLVDVDGQLGTVLRMTPSETILMDADGNHLRLPNAMVFNGKVVNYTRNPLRRFRVAVGLGNAVDLERAQNLGVRTLGRMKGVIEEPPPSAQITALGDSTVTLELFAGVDQGTASYAKVSSEAHRLVKAAFDGAGIEIPEPAYRVRLERHPSPPPEIAEFEPEAIDVSPTSDISEQVDAEIALSDEENLLSEG
jgi:small-conductance mechanosensitive channel